MKALVRSSDVGDCASQVQEAIVEVRTLSQELLNKNVNNIRRQNDGKSGFRGCRLLS